jgi:hypothetical protein
MLKLLVLLLVSQALGQLTGTMKQNVELDMELAVCSGAQNCQTGERFKGTVSQNALGQLTGTMKQNVELDMELAVCSGAQNCQTGERLEGTVSRNALAQNPQTGERYMVVALSAPILAPNILCTAHRIVKTGERFMVVASSAPTLAPSAFFGARNCKKTCHLTLRKSCFNIGTFGAVTMCNYNAREVLYRMDTKFVLRNFSIPKDI